MTDLPPPPMPNDSGDPRASRKVLIVIVIAAAAGVLLGLGFASSDDPGAAIAWLATLVAIAVPVVAVVAGVRRARRHPGAGGREFLAGCLLVLGLEIAILVIAFGACAVVAQSMFGEA